MFGLTKREQRWKAEQRLAETLIDLASTAIEATAKIRVAEAMSSHELLRRIASARHWPEEGQAWGYEIDEAAHEALQDMLKERAK